MYRLAKLSSMVVFGLMLAISLFAPGIAGQRADAKSLHPSLTRVTSTPHGVTRRVRHFSALNHRQGPGSPDNYGDEGDEGDGSDGGNGGDDGGNGVSDGGDNG